MQAHNLEEKERTTDIQIEELINFDSLLLSDRVLLGLKNNGFKKPSPIQLKAIPLGRCGFDLVVKSKSGTGKTVVFAVIALEMINIKNNATQVLILAPTREIAVQIHDVIKMLGAEYKDLKVHAFIGGLPLEEDFEKLANVCHIAVGSPGRVRQLMERGHLKLDSVRLFILDEADKLMESSYQSQVNQIYYKLPSRKQMLAVSATYPDALDTFLGRYMHHPTHVCPNVDSPLLLGLKQCVAVVKSNLNVMHQMNIKVEALEKLLSFVSYTQCLIFSNFQTRAESLSNTLNRKGWSSTFISAAQTQVDRLEAVNSLKHLKCRILSSTDITARGIDAANVDLVINFDVPFDSSTYLHRMGRAGRYGAKGIAITLAATGKELLQLQNIVGVIGGNSLSMGVLPDFGQFPDNLWNCDFNTFEQVCGIVDENCVTQQKTRLKNIKESIYELKTFQKDNTSKRSIGKQERNEQMDTDTQLNVTDIQLNDTNIQLNDTDIKLNDTAIQSNTDHVNSVGGIQLSESMTQNDKTKDVHSILDSINECNINDNLVSMSFSPQFLLQKLAKGENIEYARIDERNDNNKDLQSMDSSIEISKIEPMEISCNTNTKPIDPIEEPNNTNTSNILKDECPSKRKRENKVLIESLKTMILQRNIALYNVAKLLVQKSVSDDIDPSIIDSIQTYLSLIENEDSNKTKSISEQCQNLSCKEILESIKVLNDKTKHLQAKEPDKYIAETPNLLENLFVHAYNFATKPGATHWLDAIGEEFNEDAHAQVDYIADDGRINLLDTDEEFEDEEEFEEVSTRRYRKKSYSNNRKRYRKSEHGSVADDEFDDNCMKWVAVDPSESIFKPLVYGSKQELFIPDVIHPNMPTENISNDTYQPGILTDVEYSQNSAYASYFNEYSQQLAQKADEFETVDGFDEWLLNWQQQIQGVRDYIQQNIYLEEMNKFQCYK